MPATLESPPTTAALASLREDFPHVPIRTLPVNVTDEPDVVAAVDTAWKEPGNIRHLICCAGVVGVVPALEESVEHWRKVVDVNLTGSFLCSKTVARYAVTSTRAISSLTNTSTSAASQMLALGGRSFSYPHLPAVGHSSPSPKPPTMPPRQVLRPSPAPSAPSGLPLASASIASLLVTWIPFSTKGRGWRLHGMPGWSGVRSVVSGHRRSLLAQLSCCAVAQEAM
jgi:NAD(P)-dependent dehydrogenase (short-subunit alcohol dehydrogenase family)